MTAAFGTAEDGWTPMREILFDINILSCVGRLLGRRIGVMDEETTL